MDEQVFHGGINEVVRRGDRLYRPERPWSQAVMRLLEHVRRAGFEGAPEPFGLEAGCEVLDWVEGEVEDLNGLELDPRSQRAASECSSSPRRTD